MALVGVAMLGLIDRYRYMMTRRHHRMVVLAVTVCCALACVSDAAPPAEFEPPQPLRIGVGGDYPVGADGLLSSRGLPHERIFPWELADPEVLKRYQVLLLSCPVSTRGSLNGPLTEWLKAGGRAYVEVWAGLQGSWPLPEFVTSAGGAPQKGDALVTGSDHPAIKGLDPKTPIDLFHLRGTYLRARQPDQTDTLAQFCNDGGGAPLQRGAAVICLPVGKGALVYSGAPLTFCYFHRGPATEPLMNGIIDYLAEGRAVTRLTVSTEETVDAQPETPAEATAEEDDGGRLPPGLELIDRVENGPYNVSAQLTTGETGDQAALLLLDARFDVDGKTKRPCLWLTVDQDGMELRVGKTQKGSVIASASRQLPKEPCELLVQRRARFVSVVLGDEEILRAKTGLKPGGQVAFSNGVATLDDACCQYVGEPEFGDDFMRERGDPSGWTTVSGKWRAIGLGHERQSVNGFYFRGQGTETALTTAGFPWWEEYTCSVAARLEDGTTCGVLALQRGNGDYVAFLADSSRAPEPTLRLVRAREGVETTLAKQPGSVEPGQWYRLAVRLNKGKLEALLDGEEVVTCDYQEPRGGGVGLLVRGGSARFDDVLVQPSSRPLVLPNGEGTAAPWIPDTLGPQDRVTWANPAAAWVASAERPSLLWHTAGLSSQLALTLQLRPASEPAMRRVILAPATDSPESEWLSVTARVLPGERNASLVFTRSGKKSARRSVVLGPGGTLQLVRRGDLVKVLWRRSVVFRAAGRGSSLRRIGLEVDGPPVPAGSLQVDAPGIRDYVFGVAPSDWWVSSGTWEVASRWACDSRWSWFAGWGESDFAVWNKSPVEGDVVLEFYVGVKMKAPGGPETSRCRDLNAVVCGDKSDPRSGYSFILGGDGGVKTQLLRNGIVVAERPDVRVPAGWGIHHEWFRVRVAKVGGRIALDFEGRPVIRYEDPEPLPGGHIGLWGRNSGILIPRATIYQ